MMGSDAILLQGVKHRIDLHPLDYCVELYAVFAIILLTDTAVFVGF